MRRLLATTAIALLATGPLYAQAQDAPAAATEATGSDMLFVANEEPSDIYSSDLVGMSVYSSATDYETDYGNDRMVGADALGGWDDIGSVDDLLITADGEVKAVLVDVGGFLGIGAHTVALSMEQIHILTDETGARFAAINSSREALEAAPEFERSSEPSAAGSPDTMGAAPGAATGTMAAGEGAMAPADGTMAPADGTMAADAGAWVPIGAADVTAETLEGATVYSRQDEAIGDVSELILGSDGKITDVIVDVGGFLGMGEHSVAIGFDELEVMADPETDEVRVFTNATKDELESRPEYEG